MSGTSHRSAATLAAGLTGILAFVAATGELAGFLPSLPFGVPAALALGVLGIFVCLWLASTAAESRPYEVTLDVLLGAVSEAVFVVDVDADVEDRISRVNEAALALVGTDAAALVGASMASLLHAEPNPHDPTARDLEEGRLRRADGSTLSVEYRRTEIRSESGAVQSVVYALQIIDERK